MSDEPKWLRPIYLMHFRGSKRFALRHYAPKLRKAGMRRPLAWLFAAYTHYRDWFAVENAAADWMERRYP